MSHFQKFITIRIILLEIHVISNESLDFRILALVYIKYKFRREKTIRKSKLTILDILRLIKQFRNFIRSNGDGKHSRGERKAERKKVESRVEIICRIHYDVLSSSNTPALFTSTFSIFRFARGNLFGFNRYPPCKFELTLHPWRRLA